MTACNETERTFMLNVDIESSTELSKAEKKAFFSRAVRDRNCATQRGNNWQISTLKKENSAEYSSEILQ